jgi:hypothetical protein
MRLIIPLAVIVTLFLWYALQGRKWLKTKPWAEGFFTWIEPIEIVLYKKSETILWARIKIIIGMLLTIMTYLGTIDLTPLMPFVPDQYESTVKALFNLLPLTISLLGMVDERLRNGTSLPLEIVSASDSTMTPKVAQAIATAADAKADAVAAVAEAKKA